jgi:hypothetical protein
MTNRVLLIPALLSLSACQAAPPTETQSERLAAQFIARDLVEDQAGSFLAYDETNTYFIDASHNLWIDTFDVYNTKMTRTLLSANVSQVQRANGQFLWLLDTNGSLWYENLISSPPSKPEHIADNVIQFSGTPSQIVYFKPQGTFDVYRAWPGFVGEKIYGNGLEFVGVDATHVYIRDAGTSAQLYLFYPGTKQSPLLCDGLVENFRPNDGLIYVHGIDTKLWREVPGAGHGPNPVDDQVGGYQPWDTSFIFVQGYDRNLWREDGDWTHRDLVDGNVSDFQATSLHTVWVRGLDGKLWREHLGTRLP